MSEKDKTENARRKGRRAFYDGVAREDNPMTARDSCLAWDDAWIQAKEASERISEHFNPDAEPNVCKFCGGPAIGSSICFKCLETA